MSEALPSLDPPPALDRPALPVPTRGRWQPLRLGLVELYHYDSEEFWFRDGHLLLRGNNGTGKSKVLSLTLPFLLDARLLPSRIEPDGDAGKRMAWNLLMGSYDRRVGYAWIEFGRLADDGTPHYLTLGAGLSASAARAQVDSWFFVLDDAPQGRAQRLNQDWWLTSPQRQVLGKERLRETLTGLGQVFDTGQAYRRAVDERLFKLGPRRYDALMDTLIQLRAPQLSKKPDESALSNALTEALPPLAAELLHDVAEALGQLEEDRRQLETYQAMATAVGRFDLRYRAYAGTQSRRQARSVRQAQTEFDSASRARQDSLARQQAATLQETEAQAGLTAAELALLHQRTRVDTLLADPAMQDANRLEGADREAAARAAALQGAGATLAETGRRLARSQQESRDAEQRLAQATQQLADARQTLAAAAVAAGLTAALASQPLVALPADALVALAAGPFEAAPAGLRALLAGRREQVALLRQRHNELAQAIAQQQQRRQSRDDALDATEAAAARRTLADEAVLQQGQALQDAWQNHAAGLRQLPLAAAPAQAALTELATWVATLQGDNPAQALLQQAQQQASLRQAARQVALAAQQQTLADEEQALLAERSALLAGVDAMPPAPYTRAADARDPGRPGAPLWQLLEFRDTVDAPQRAGLEAALEAAGLLDAWVWPSGQVQAADGQTLLHDRYLSARPPQATALSRWLQPAETPHNATHNATHAVPAASVERLLAGVACSAQDPGDADSWVSPSGQFRLGALAGAWHKPAAVYIGFAARAAARAQRLAAIAQRLLAWADEQAALQAALATLQQDQRQAEHEWRSAPGDAALRQAHLQASHSARELLTLRGLLDRADGALALAAQATAAARAVLAQDATDLRLPEALAALAPVDAALGQFDETQHRLLHAARELRGAAPALQRQRGREAELQADQQQAEQQVATCRAEAEQASARLQVLQQTVGAQVGELQRQLSQARQAVTADERRLRAAGEAARAAGEARAVAGAQAGAAEAELQRRSQARALAVARLQQFAATGLLAAALPQLELPDASEPWTIDPALTLARRAEQLLSAVADDDEAWARVQRRVTEELTELQRSLGALGHQAPAETSDWGLVVHIIYQNQPERPDRLAARLADEINQRSELLTAIERGVLENHLQAEIAAEVQRLLQAAERQVEAINRELHKRPTSTGVRFRLLWQPLAEADGAPVGLETARKRLLHTSADLWSAEDRRVVGAMLQQRIEAERASADQGLGKDGGGGLLDQLARALDYRHWHRFRVERWQDGQWRKLSGPASSGERALGLTVPLFAAVASFYSQSGNASAPRLMLLDEAFAGIDDAARAHCMGLIREFDLDFVITSEREWACYAELPGVSICQLQRREGVDAVFVSRWAWDGRAKLRMADPDRHQAPAPA